MSISKRSFRQGCAALTGALVLGMNAMTVYAEFGPSAAPVDTNQASIQIAVQSNTLEPSPFASNIYAAVTDGYYCDAITTYSYENMRYDLNLLQQNYSGVRTDSLGTTLDGRSIEHVMIGNAEAPHHMLVVGSIHGREFICTQLIMRQMKDILECARTGQLIGSIPASAVLENVCIHFVPMACPDGVTLSQQGLGGIVSETLKSQLQAIIDADRQREGFIGNTDWYFRRWKDNAAGVDINRNFPLGWESMDDGRYQPSYEFYKGPFAGSEAETQALVNILGMYPFHEILNYHAQGQVIYWYYGLASEAVNQASRMMAETVQRNTGYIISDGGTSSKPAPSYKEITACLGIPSVTVEVGIGSCPLPATDIDDIWARNAGVLRELAAGLAVS